MKSRVLKHGENRITQGFKATHRAVDLGKNHLTEPVIAHTAGVVSFCQTGQKNNKNSTGNKSYGNCVKLDHGNGVETLYAHLASVSVKLGEQVAAGQVLGAMGNTGRSFGAHLHFEVRKGGVKVDPTPYLTADLPVPKRINVSYRTHVGGRWLPRVTNCGEGSNGYAGLFGKAVSAVEVRPACGVAEYRVHELGGGWLPWVTSKKSHAGVRGKPVDALQMRLKDAEGYEIRYRVTSLKTPDWHQWCTGTADATGDGYAGVFGSAIDGVQMEITEV